MRSTILDGSKEDRERFDRLLKDADVFFSNRRPGYLERYGLTAEELRHAAGFLSLIEVMATTILDNNQQTGFAKKLDRYCRVIFPAIFAIACVAILAHPRG